MKSFIEAMRQAGYEPALRKSPFGGSGADSADFLLAALKVGQKINTCFPFWATAGVANQTRYTKGGAYFKIQWQLYSKLEQKVIYQAVTEGKASREELKPDEGREVSKAAFRMALDNLLARPGFHAAIAGAQAKNNPAESKTAISRNQHLGFTAPKRPRRVLPAQMEKVRQAVVTILGGVGSHGSGFFISPDGYLLTNRHVVGSHRMVRIRLHNRLEVKGRVLKADAKRDIALVKVDGQDLPYLALSKAALPPGSRVFAIGTPRKQEFAGAVSQGVVSAYRKKKKTGLIFLQSDVTIHGGSSGGPLINERGEVVAIAVQYGDMAWGVGKGAESPASA